MTRLHDTDLLRIPEVGRRLALGQTKVRELIHTGQLPSVRIGRAVRVPAADVAAFVVARTENAR